MKYQKSYTIEEKERALEEYRNSTLSLNEFTKQKNIPMSTFRGWLDKENEIRFGEINIGDDTTKVPPPRATTVFLNDSIRIELKDGYDKTFLKNILEVILQDAK